MAFINPSPFTTRPEIEGTFGVVTSTHWIATAVGMSILEKGGNAFDAGCATAFTLQVVEPHLNGPGGDVPSPINPPSGCHFHTRCPYAVERCRAETPALREVRPGQMVACHVFGPGSAVAGPGRA